MVSPLVIDSQNERLHPSAQAVLQASPEERLEFLNKQFWIGYPAAINILMRLEHILSRPQIGRPEGISIIGGSNNGKTHLLDYFLKLHPATLSPGNTTMQIQVLSIEAPVGASRADFFDSLCYALHIPEISSGPMRRVRGRVNQALREAGVKVIIIDELHNLIAGGEMRKRIILEQLKTFSNEHKIAVVGAGTDRALNTISLDEQYMSRMPPVKLPPWKMDRTFLGLLKAIEARMPLNEPSMLTDRNLAEFIFSQSKQSIGHAVGLIVDSTRLAIYKGKEKVTENLIRQVCAGDFPWTKV